MIGRDGIALCTDQDLTGSAADAGGWNSAGDADYANVMISLTANDSVNPRVQLLGGDNYGNSYYVEAVTTVPGATLTTDGSQTYYELDADTTQTIAIPYPLNKCWDKVKVQVWAGTAGSTPSTVSVYLKLG